MHFGTCHRCGWRQEVSRVTCADRLRFEMNRDYGRLCEECRRDLAAIREHEMTQTDDWTEFKAGE
jgi:hypothetical protein